MQVAFLRSINVGGRRVKNDELIAIFEGLGLLDVHAYQAAGNLVFRGDITEDALQKGLSAALSYDVPVLLRSSAQVIAIADSAPFTAEEHAASSGKVQVTMLATQPEDEAVLAHQTADDRLRLVGRELYWLPIGGMSDSVLDTRAIQRDLGMMTTRTQGTLVRLAKRFLR